MNRLEDWIAMMGLKKDIHEMQEVLTAYVEEEQTLSLATCLSFYTKEDLKSLTKENQYRSVKQSVTKGEMVSQLEQAICQSFREMLDCSTMLELQYVAFALVANGEVIEEFEPFYEFITRGFAFQAIQKGSKNPDECTILFPRELAQIFSEWLSDEQVELAVKREFMHMVLMGMTNLYGVFSKEHLRTLWSTYFEGELIDEDMLQILVSSVPGHMQNYEGLGDLIVQTELLAEDDWKEILLHAEKTGYYEPTLDEIVYYAEFPFDSKGDTYQKLFYFFRKQLFNVEQVERLMQDVCMMSICDVGIPFILEMVEAFGVFNLSLKERTELMRLVAEHVRNTRKWTLGGYREIELPNKDANAPAVTGKKISRNKPCPCGSGKKYKFCCGKRL